MFDACPANWEYEAPFKLGHTTVANGVCCLRAIFFSTTVTDTALALLHEARVQICVWRHSNCFHVRHVQRSVCGGIQSAFMWGTCTDLCVAAFKVLSSETRSKICVWRHSKCFHLRHVQRSVCGGIQSDPLCCNHGTKVMYRNRKKNYAGSEKPLP